MRGILLIPALVLLAGCLVCESPLTAQEVFPRAPYANAEVASIAAEGVGPDRLVQRGADTEVWVREMHNDDYVLALVNRSSDIQDVRVPFASFGAGGLLNARDCASGRAEGVSDGEYVALLPPKTIRWVRLSVVPCAKCL